MSNWMSLFRNPESTLFIPSDPQSTSTLSLTTYNIPPKVEIFKKNINAIGIDLGTSRCCVAVSRTHSFETVGIENNGDRLMPSYISFIDKDVPQCGQIVVEQLKYAAKSTIFDSKRLIGKEFEYIDPDPAWPFELANIDGMAGFQIQSKNGPMLLTPEEVSAVLLKHIKKEVEKFQGKILSKAVITIPAAFTESQKQITIKAAKMAEWSPRLLPEPIAAVFAYFNNHEYEENSTLLLFDLGGGTLDICLFLNKYLMFL
uniref:Uncharacterized protein n=1 Tax=Panagrolaimus davidi TaxID=227884 RepID=A0A914PP73_9BILA